MWMALILHALANDPVAYGPGGASIPTLPGAGAGEFSFSSDGPCGAWQASSGPVTVQVPFGDTSYPVDLYGKPGQEGPRRTVVLLHGAGGNARKVVGQTGFDEVIARDGGLLVVPQAIDVPQIGPLWDNGTLKDGEGRDDAAFLDVVSAWVDANACASKTLAVGFSNGAQMAARWACQSEAPDAVMTHAGSLKVPECRPRGRWMLAYVGTADAYKRAQSPETIGDMAHVWNAGQTTPVREPDEVEHEGKRTCSTWTGGNPVTLCVLQGWGHKWPSPITNSKMPFDATAHAWTFFNERVR